MDANDLTKVAQRYPLSESTRRRNQSLGATAAQPVVAPAIPTDEEDIRTDHPRPAAELEPGAGHEPLAAVEVQAKAGPRFLVRVKSFRRRLLDEDNLMEKWTVDTLRNACVVPDDAPGTAHIEVSQEKVGSKDEERILVEVFDNWS